jgi:hypothetical protein
MKETELPDEPPSILGKPPSTRRQIDRGSAGSLQNLATRHFNFAAKSPEAPARVNFPFTRIDGDLITTLRASKTVSFE